MRFKQKNEGKGAAFSGSFLLHFTGLCTGAGGRRMSKNGLQTENMHEFEGKTTYFYVHGVNTYVRLLQSTKFAV